jgi:hypothetical protein
MNNTRPLRFTAAAGTKFAGPSYKVQSLFSLITCPYRIFSFIDHAILLDRTFVHCPKFLTAALGAETLFDSGVAVRSRKPAGDLRLGGLLTLVGTKRGTDILIPGRVDHWRMYFGPADLSRLDDGTIRRGPEFAISPMIYEGRET